MQLGILLGIKVISLNIWIFQDLKNINISVKSTDFAEMFIDCFQTCLMAFHWLRPGVKPTEKVWISNYNFPSIWTYQTKGFYFSNHYNSRNERVICTLQTKTHFFLPVFILDLTENNNTYSLNNANLLRPTVTFLGQWSLMGYR